MTDDSEPKGRLFDGIVVRRASENNLRGIDVDIPHGRITVVTGVSGSGKSSLAFDVIFREAQRRYMESFPAYARRFLGKLRRPDVAHVTGLSPAIAVSQRTVTGNPRSTVGTLTELYDILRLLYARLGDAPPGVKPERSPLLLQLPARRLPRLQGPRRRGPHRSRTFSSRTRRRACARGRSSSRRRAATSSIPR